MLACWRSSEGCEVAESAAVDADGWYSVTVPFSEANYPSPLVVTYVAAAVVVVVVVVSLSLSTHRQYDRAMLSIHMLLEQSEDADEILPVALTGTAVLFFALVASSSRYDIDACKSGRGSDAVDSSDAHALWCT